MIKKYDIIVIGAGAAGLMAAGQAAQQGAKTLLLEKMHRPGRKLRITGKGRCNLTNTAALADFIARFGKNGRFLRQPFSRFFSEDLVAFFDRLNVTIVRERGGRIFPKSEQAGEVVDALVAWASNCGVELRSNMRVRELLVQDDQLIGLKAAFASTPKKEINLSDSGLTEYSAAAVILASGGASYPATGSTGDGYRLAESAGHSIIPVRPALVPLETAGTVCRDLQGLSLKNVEASTWLDGKKKASGLGELLFTHFGLSGPLILTQSSMAVDALQNHQKVEIHIDLKPALDPGKLRARLLREFEANGKQQLQTLLKGLLPKKLIPVCLALNKLEGTKKVSQVSAAERKKLEYWLKNFTIQVSGHRGFSEAIVSAGGVALGEVNPRTMESKKVDGLFFAGELLDINGDTGGYNLQAAFSTGWLAGVSAVQKIKK